MKYEKPYYTLKINSEYCGYRITVNGCFIEVNKGGEPLNMEYPINQWLRSGENKIEVFFFNAVHPETLIRQLAKEAKLNCQLLLREFDKEDKVSISSIILTGAEVPRMPDSLAIDYNNAEGLLKTVRNSTQKGNYSIESNQCISSNTGNIEISEITVDTQYSKCLHLAQKITLEVPFPEWAFFRGQDDFILRSEMNEEQWNDMKAELLVELQKVWDVVNSGDVEGLKPFLEARCLEYDQAFYDEPGEELKGFIRTINQDILDPDHTLPPIELKYTDISVGYERNILWLHENNHPQGSIFQFHLKDSNIAKKYPFYYSKIDGKWVIVR